MSSPPWLLLVLHLGGYALTAVQTGVVLQVLIAAASHFCGCDSSVAIPICLEL